MKVNKALVYPKTKKNFKIICHIESYDTCIKY